MKKQYKTIHVDAAVKDELEVVCKKNNWPISLVTEQLILKFVNGKFSGSLNDVVRRD